MHTKNFILTVIIVFVVNSILNFLLHALILPWESYAGSIPAENATTLGMILLFVGNLAFSYFFCFIFTKGYEKKGIGEGIRYGLLIGFLYYFSYLFYNYGNFQYSTFLLWGEFIGGVVLTVLMGITAAVLYKPKTNA